MPTQHKTLATVSVVVAVAATLGIAVVPPAQATVDFTWTGAGDGSSWSDENNWSPTGVPDQSTEDATINGSATVYVNSNLSLGRVRVGDGAVLERESGSLTTTRFELLGGGTLNMKVTTAAFSASGLQDKTIGPSGGVDATRVVGTDIGIISVLDGRLLLAATGTPLKAAATIKITGQIDGTGSNGARIEVTETSCGGEIGPLEACGIAVGEPSEYGAALEGVVVVVNHIAFLDTGSEEPSVLSMRGGAWRPAAPNGETSLRGRGIFHTGAPFPPGYTGDAEVAVALPTYVGFSEGVEWKHSQGAIAGNSTFTPNMPGGAFIWEGGSIQGSIRTIRTSDTEEVSVAVRGLEDEPLELLNLTRGGSSLDFGGGVSFDSGILQVGGQSKILSASSALMSPGFSFTKAGTGSTGRVTNEGEWAIMDGDGTLSATISDLPFISTGKVSLAAYTPLILRGDVAHSFSGETTVGVVDAETFGRVNLEEGSTLKLAGTLTLYGAAEAGLEAGDDLLIVDASESKEGAVQGGFTSIQGGEISPTLGITGSLAEDGFSLTVGGPEPVTLSASSPDKVKQNKPWQITYTIANESAGDVTPTLVLPRLKDSTMSSPGSITCTAKAGRFECELPDLNAGKSMTVVISYTFKKTGRKTVEARVLTAGFNPDPAKARAKSTVMVTRR